MTVNYLGPASRSARNDNGKRSYVISYNLETTSQSDSAYLVGSHPSLPKIGDVFADDPGAWCNSLEIDNSAYWKGWTATATWSSERELATDPTNDPAIITVSTEQFQKVADRDKFGYSVCNSAGDPFDPPYMMDDSRRVIQIQKNMSGHPSWILSYADVVNSDVFVVKGVSYAIGTAKVQRVSIGPTESRNGVPFVVVSIDIHCQRDGWLLRPLDAGFRELAWDGLTRINIYTPDSTGDTTGGGERITAPVPLDGSGQALANPTTATSVFGSFTVYTTAAFNGNIPLT